MEYVDKVIMCADENCEQPNSEFICTAKSQEWLASKGFPLPKRCKDCRERKKNRSHSPFKEVADRVAHGDFSPTRRGKKHQNHRRHGREGMNDYE